MGIFATQRTDIRIHLLVHMFTYWGCQRVAPAVPVDDPHVLNVIGCSLCRYSARETLSCPYPLKHSHIGARLCSCLAAPRMPMKH